MSGATPSTTTSPDKIMLNDSMASTTLHDAHRHGVLDRKAMYGRLIDAIAVPSAARPPGGVPRDALRDTPRDAPDDNDGAPDDDLLCDALRHDAFHDTLHGTLSGTLRDTPHNDVFRGVPCSTIHHGAQRDDTPPDGRAPAPPDPAAPGERD